MRCFLVLFRFRHCHNLEFQFVVSFLFAGGDKPTFKTTAGWCVAHRKGFAWKECRELTHRERNIDFADGVAMATAKKITKLLVICRQCDLNLPQRVPTTLEGKNSEVWDTQLSSKRPLEPSPSPNEPSQKKIATPSSDSSFSTPHKAIVPKALLFATPSSKSKSNEPPMALRVLYRAILGNGYAGLSLSIIFRLVVVSRRGPGGGARVRSAEKIYATREDFFFRFHKRMRIFEPHRAVCSTVAFSPILAVQLATRALIACNYCQNHLLTLSVDVQPRRHTTRVCVSQFL